ncbi:thiol-disulfide oxidoreductase DCC family protein [Engelhardtia mirabilis]|uniref:Thiol-disulfide oxidoreductase DCC n=1 Tax=Engelhardtia mirabilis TaxID=2528011 RepID=A0A518BMG6_9BACT|nr:hypothetical protein Pla133_32410 [Planctomycetes bacterium Pla133]QDV02473.1 hypothetical protein Pla86_32400 [Planctomycetes bacterium Pla86]
MLETPTDLTDVAAGRPLVLYDGDCGLCERSVQFILERDPKERFVFAPLQSQLARDLIRSIGADPDRLETIVLRDEAGRMHLRSGAALRIAARLRAPWPLLAAGLVLPPLLRDGVYKWIARRRLRWFGSADSCRLPDPKRPARFLR